MTPSEIQKKEKVKHSKKPDKIQKPKSKIGDKERLSKFNKKIFHKGYTLDCRNICCKFNRANNASDLKNQ